MLNRIQLSTAVLVVICASVALLATGCDSDPVNAAQTETATTTITETAGNTDYPEMLHEGSAPGNGTFTMCDDKSAIATNVTSCEFAMSVKEAYQGNPRPTVRAYSPVTRLWYDMTCATGVSVARSSGQVVSAVVCAGGNNAKVVVLP